ncbi:hypothetical protein [Marinifilum fragile]|uniref:hypothetical protein n=1 Tax=Marinifilum fragile TaxID=570161 RepID=UPI002AAB80D0|nr:hypothetical protein [Marinifilum fragile]
MKKLLNFILLVLSSITVYSQVDYRKVYEYGEYQENWAKVKSITGTYGFVDKSGNEIVEPINTLKQIESKHYKIVTK